MLRSVGLDVHRESVVVCIMDAAGAVLRTLTVPTTRPGLEAFARQELTGEDQLALEATFNCWAVLSVLRPFVARVTVSNPLTTRAIAEAKIKTDKVEARVLADLLRTRYLPEVWTPDALTQQQRTLTHRRATKRERGRGMASKGGKRGRPRAWSSVAERQRALRATVEWSYRLLSEPLQRFFCRLSVFRGGWVVEAAEAVGEEGVTSLAGPALDALGQLRDCSLVETEERGEGIRFRMLETMREYAAELLDAAAEAEATRKRHAAHFLALAERAAPELRGPEQAAWLERLEVDHDNLRAALDWTMQRGAEMSDAAAKGSTPNVEWALRFCDALWHFWSVRGHVAEGRRRLAAVLAKAPPDHPVVGRSPLRAGALVAAGVLTHDQSDYEAALALLEEGAVLWRLLAAPAGAAEGSGQELGRALNCLANLRLDQGHPELALPLYQEALERFRAASDAAGTAIALSNLGVLHLERGESDLAAQLLTESIRLKRTLGNAYGLAMSLESLGNLERSRGDRERASELGEEALAIRRELGHRLGIAMSLNNLGHLLLESGDPAGAAACLRESLELLLELDEPRSVLEALTGLAGTAAATGRHEAAARLLAAMEAQREAHGFAPRPCEKAVIKRWRAEVRNALEAARFDSLWQEGRAIRVEAALELVRSLNIMAAPGVVDSG